MSCEKAIDGSQRRRYPDCGDGGWARELSASLIERFI